MAGKDPSPDGVGVGCGLSVFRAASKEVAVRLIGGFGACGAKAAHDVRSVNSCYFASSLR